MGDVRWVVLEPSLDGKIARWPDGHFKGHMATTLKALGNTSPFYGDPKLAEANMALALAALGLNDGRRRLLTIKPRKHNLAAGDGISIVVPGRDAPNGAYIEADGLIGRGEVIFQLRSGDCPPVGLLDATYECKALLHAGRKEVQLGVVSEGVRAFANEYGLQGKDIWLGVAPGIKRCCYRNPEKLSEVIDLQGEIVEQARAAGVTNVIEIATHCTSCSSTLEFYSHRRSDDLGQDVEPEGRDSTYLW